MRGLSLVAASGGHSSSRCAGLSLLRPLLLRSTGSRRAGSVIVAHGPSCSAARGILPDQGSNPCALHWQADSQPLRHQGSPEEANFTKHLSIGSLVRSKSVSSQQPPTFPSTPNILSRVQIGPPVLCSWKDPSTLPASPSLSAFSIRTSRITLPTPVCASHHRKPGLPRHPSSFVMSSFDSLLQFLKSCLSLWSPLPVHSVPSGSVISKSPTS